MEAEKNVLIGLLTKSLNKTEEEVSDLLYQKAEDSDELVLKEDALPLVLDHDATRIANVKKAVKPDKARLESEYSRGAKETMDRFELSAKELYNVSSEAQGLDLVKEIINTVSECNVITDENVKSHAVYLELEKNSVAKKELEELNQEFTDYKLNQDKTSRLSTVKRDALPILAAMNPIISENQLVAQTRQSDFLTKLEGYEYDLAEDGNHLIKKNGSRLEDEHANPIKFADFIASVAALNYDFKQSGDKGQSGNQNTGGNGAGGAIDVPKDEKDYLAKMSELMAANDKEGAIKLRKAWMESQ